MALLGLGTAILVVIYVVISALQRSPGNCGRSWWVSLVHPGPGPRMEADPYGPGDRLRRSRRLGGRHYHRSRWQSVVRRERRQTLHRKDDSVGQGHRVPHPGGWNTGGLSASHLGGERNGLVLDGFIRSLPG